MAFIFIISRSLRLYFSIILQNNYIETSQLSTWYIFCINKNQFKNNYPIIGYFKNVNN